MMQLPDAMLPWPIPFDGVTLIAESEQGPGGDVALKAYRCPAGVWTIAWGETDNVHPGDTCTKQEADKWLCDDLTERCAKIKEMCKVEPSLHELAAMASLAYNIGLAALGKSTVMRLHNAGKTQEAAQAFGLFNKAKDANTGKLVVFNGLTVRRAKESALYLTPDVGETRHVMPQEVAEQPTVKSSPTVQSNTVAVGIGGATLAFSQFQEFFGPIMSFVKERAADFGLTSTQALAIVLIIVGGISLQRRLKQRQDGTA